jgi:hypothetical protein
VGPCALVSYCVAAILLTSLWFECSHNTAEKLVMMQHQGGMPDNVSLEEFNNISGSVGSSTPAVVCTRDVFRLHRCPGRVRSGRRPNFPICRLGHKWASSSPFLRLLPAPFRSLATTVSSKSKPRPPPHGQRAPKRATFLTLAATKFFGVQL